MRRTTTMLVTRPALFLSTGLFAILLSSGCGPEYPNCDDDDDCRDAEYCVNGLCQKCRGDQDCPAGQRCARGLCEAIAGYCESSADCPDGQECQNNVCVAAAPMSQPEAGPTGCELAAVHFAFDADELDTAARNTIQANANCMRERSHAGLHLTGHCDPRGTEEYNLALGDRRARAVLEYMVGLGVSAEALSSSSMGEEMARGADEPSWSQDRRVEFRAR